MEKQNFIGKATEYLAEWDPAFITQATDKTEYEAEAGQLFDALEQKKSFAIQNIAETIWHILKNNFEGCLYGVTETELMFGYSPDNSDFSCKCLRFAKKMAVEI